MNDTQDWIGAKEEFGDKMRSISHREFGEKCNRCRHENGKLTKPCVICAAKGLQDCIDETEPTNEQKSRFIFEELEMGCWHKTKKRQNNEGWECLKCHNLFPTLPSTFKANPNFFTSDADCRKALIILAEKGLLYMTTQKLLEIANLNFNMDLLLTTPEQKAEAIFQTLKNREKKDDQTPSKK